MNEFIPKDHEQRARDRLRNLKQSGSVSKYLSEFRNITLSINDMTVGEKIDRFVSGLKREVKLEVLKMRSTTFEDTASIAIQIDSAIWRSGEGNSYTSSQGTSSSSFGAQAVPDPMEIGNIQRGRQLTEEQRWQRKKDLQNNACTQCHVKGCRPWICGKKEKLANNLEASSDSNRHQQLENGTESSSGEE